MDEVAVEERRRGVSGGGRSLFLLWTDCIFSLMTTMSDEERKWSATTTSLPPKLFFDRAGRYDEVARAVSGFVRIPRGDDVFHDDAGNGVFKTYFRQTGCADADLEAELRDEFFGAYVVHLPGGAYFEQLAESVAQRQHGADRNIRALCEDDRAVKGDNS